jgi:hypothetical protein
VWGAKLVLDLAAFEPYTRIDIILVWRKPRSLQRDEDCSGGGRVG